MPRMTSSAREQQRPTPCTRATATIPRMASSAREQQRPASHDDKERSAEDQRKIDNDKLNRRGSGQRLPMYTRPEPKKRAAPVKTEEPRASSGPVIERRSRSPEIRRTRSLRRPSREGLEHVKEERAGSSGSTDRVKRGRSRSPLGRVKRGRSRSPLGRKKRDRSRSPLGRMKRDRSRSPLGRMKRERSRSPLGRVKRDRSRSPGTEDILDRPKREPELMDDPEPSREPPYDDAATHKPYDLKDAFMIYGALTASCPERRAFFTQEYFEHRDRPNNERGTTEDIRRFYDTHMQSEPASEPVEERPVKREDPILERPHGMSNAYREDAMGTQRSRKITIKETRKETVAEVLIGTLRKMRQDPRRDALIDELRANPALDEFDVARDAVTRHALYFAHELCSGCIDAESEYVVNLPVAYQPNVREHDSDSDQEFMLPRHSSHEDLQEVDNAPAWKSSELCVRCHVAPRAGTAVSCRFDVSSRRAVTRANDAQLITTATGILQTARNAFTHADESGSRVHEERLADIHHQLRKEVARYDERLRREDAKSSRRGPMLLDNAESEPHDEVDVTNGTDRDPDQLDDRYKEGRVDIKMTSWSRSTPKNDPIPEDNHGGRLKSGNTDEKKKKKVTFSDLRWAVQVGFFTANSPVTDPLLKAFMIPIKPVAESRTVTKSRTELVRFRRYIAKPNDKVLNRGDEETVGLQRKYCLSFESPEDMKDMKLGSGWTYGWIKGDTTSVDPEEAVKLMQMIEKVDARLSPAMVRFRAKNVARTRRLVDKDGVPIENYDMQVEPGSPQQFSDSDNEDDGVGDEIHDWSLPL